MSRPDNKHAALLNLAGETSGATDDLERKWLIDKLSGGTTSPEVQAVFDRMSALTQTEMDAIEALVDGLVADGLYSAVDEIYAPCLNATDYLTGFKVDTLINSAAPGTHVPGQYIDFTANNQHVLEGRAYDSFAVADHAMGCYVVMYDPDTGGNSDLFGLATAGIEAYYRWRGNDTNDENCLIHVTSATPRAAVIQRPTGDVVGAGFDGGGNIIQLTVGGLTDITARTPEGVPATHPMQWHGQNIDGVPATGNVTNSRYSVMFHLSKTSPMNLTTMRTRLLQFLSDIGVTGLPVFTANSVIQTGDAINDLWLAEFKAAGATSGDFNTAAYEYLIIQGVTPGALSEMWDAFWISQIP
jgi:hypothetical protein